MRIPIVSITGRSGSGKTTLTEKLIPELVNRHYKVATVKHDAPIVLSLIRKVRIAGIIRMRGLP